MREIMQKVTRGTEQVLRSPGASAAFYLVAAMAVAAVVWTREEE